MHTSSIDNPREAEIISFKRLSNVLTVPKNFRLGGLYSILNSAPALIPKIDTSDVLQQHVIIQIKLKIHSKNLPITVKIKEKNKAKEAPISALFIK